MYYFTKKKVILSRDVIFNDRSLDMMILVRRQSHISMYTLIALMKFKIQIVTLWKKVWQVLQKKVLQMPKKKFQPSITILHLLCVHKDVLNKRKENLIDMAFHAISLLLKNQFP